MPIAEAEPPRPLPALGVALGVRDLPAHLDWILEADRDVELQDFIDAGLLSGGGWRERAAEARRLLAGHRGRLGIHGPFWGFSLATEDPEVRAVVARRMAQGLEVCGALGATQMVVHSPFTHWQHQNLPMTPGARQALADRVHASLGAAVRAAEAAGVTIVIENVEDCDPEARVGLARSFDSAAVAVSLDTGHAHYAHVSTGAPPADYFAAAAGAALAHVHLQDADGYADRHWEPGLGTVNWPALFAALAALPGLPRLMLELRDVGRAPAGAAWLERAGLAR